MQRQEIPVEQVVIRPFDLWSTSWGLLACGNFAARQFNCMTVGWGSMGVMWRRPFLMVVVRPTRYTYQFMEQTDNFTLCVFPLEYHPQLEMLGQRSGREMDKVNASGLTPIAASRVSSPIFQEAELAIECRKIYFDDFDPGRFLADYIHGLYNRDYHRMYFGEILAVSGTDKYRKS